MASFRVAEAEEEIARLQQNNAPQDEIDKAEERLEEALESMLDGGFDGDVCVVFTIVLVSFFYSERRGRKVSR